MLTLAAKFLLLGEFDEEKQVPDTTSLSVSGFSFLGQKLQKPQHSLWTVEHTQFT